MRTLAAVLLACAMAAPAAAQSFSLDGLIKGANSVKKALLAIPGVSDVGVEVPEKRVTVSHDERVTRTTVVDGLKKAGFQPA